MRTIGEENVDLEESAFPESFLFARNAAFPFLQVENSGSSTGGASKESERMILTPLLSLFTKPVLTERHGGRTLCLLSESCGCMWVNWWVNMEGKGTAQA